MMVPNLIGVLILSPIVLKITKNYIDRVIKKKPVAPVLSYNQSSEDVSEAAE